MRHEAPGDRATIAFVADISDPQEVKPGERLFAGLASTRLRMLIPARELAAHLRVLLVPFDAFLADPALLRFGRLNAVVVSKLPLARVLERKDALGAMLARLRGSASGSRRFADLCDDYETLGEQANAPFLGTYFRGLCETCEIVVPSEAMRALVTSLGARAAHLIEDPWEIESVGTARFAPASRLRLLWFGNLGLQNAQLVANTFALVLKRLRGHALHLSLVAHADTAPLALQIGDKLRRLHPDCAFEFLPWSPETTESALAACDAALLPQNLAARWGRVMSHNRLVSVLRAGRLALASPMPAYLELKDHAWVGENLADGLEWALANPHAACARILSGQRAVAHRFSPRAVGERWREALASRDDTPTRNTLD